MMAAPMNTPIAELSRAEKIDLALFCCGVVLFLFGAGLVLGSGGVLLTSGAGLMWLASK